MNDTLDLRFEIGEAESPVAGFDGGLTRGQLLCNARVLLFLIGQLRTKGKSPQWQLARIALSGVMPRLRRLSSTLTIWAYNAYAWSVLVAIGAVAWPCVLLTPRRIWRHRFLSAAARLFFRLIGCPLTITRDAPDPKDNAILVASIDHGCTPPSTLAARTVASTGASLSASVAAGIMSINRHHGGAIEDCARYLRSIIERSISETRSLDEIATDEVARVKSEGARISGFGHRVHTKDPRTTRLLEFAAEAGMSDSGRTCIAAARAVERAFAAIGRPLPINVDGAIGAILADLGMDPAVFNGIFMIARTPGLVAHVVEEQTREKPMRRIDPVRHAYDGPIVR